jgi:RNA polymerase sigma-70 factor (ECF subfamily)
MIDTDTLQQLRDGNIHAFERVVQAYQHEMLCVATRIIGQLADAEEVRQRILMRIWQSPQNLPSQDRFEAWLRRCVVNESISFLRQRKREFLRNTDYSANRPAESSELLDSDVEQLRSALSQLEPEQRAILALKFDQQLTVREMGQVLQQAHTTIQSKLDRAIAKLRSLMQTAGMKT